MNKLLMKFKKIISPFLLIFFISDVTAGPYLGTNVGASFVTMSKNIDYNTTTANLTSDYTGVRAQIFFGYDLTMLYLSNTDSADDMYVALEADGNYISGNNTTSIKPWFLNINASVKEQVMYGYDFFLLGKYRSAKQVYFLGPGYSLGYFQASNTSETAGNLGVSKDFSKNAHGWSVKTGVETNIWNKVSLVVAYQFTKYNNFSSSAIEPLTEENVSVTYNPVINSLMIGIRFF